MPTLQAGSFGAGGIQTSLLGPWGLGSLLPYPGLVPPGEGGATVEIKMGMEWGKRRNKSPHPLLPWGQGIIPLEGQRQEVETPGAGFFKTGLILIFIIFSVFP